MNINTFCNSTIDHILKQQSQNAQNFLDPILLLSGQLTLWITDFDLGSGAGGKMDFKDKKSLVFERLQQELPDTEYRTFKRTQAELANIYYKNNNHESLGEKDLSKEAFQKHLKFLCKLFGRYAPDAVINSDLATYIDTGMLPDASNGNAPGSLSLKNNELVTRIAQPVPIVFCIDNSLGTQGYMAETRRHLLELTSHLLETDSTRNKVEVCIITMGDKDTDPVLLPFTPLPDITDSMINIQARGKLNLASGISKAISVLDAQLEKYKLDDRNHFRPWLVIFSKGNTTEDISEVASKIRKRSQEGIMRIEVVAMTNKPNMDILCQITDKENITRFDQSDNTAINTFFDTLEQSVQIVSQSVPGGVKNLNNRSTFI